MVTVVRGAENPSKRAARTAAPKPGGGCPQPWAFLLIRRKAEGIRDPQRALRGGGRAGCSRCLKSAETPGEHSVVGAERANPAALKVRQVPLVAIKDQRAAVHLDAAVVPAVEGVKLHP